MSRINTNVSSLLAQRILGQNNKTLSTSLERLSTGFAINRGADDPAGLIASENLRSEKAAISAAIGNAERADQVINIAEGGLQEVSNLLIEVQSLVTETANDAGLSIEEKEANQLQIDSILQTIDRIANSTSFQGVKLLNGTFDFTVASQAATVADFQINAAKLEHDDSRVIQVLVTASAQHGGLFLSAAGPVINLSSESARLTFDLAGAKGSREFSFASGTALSAVVAAINTFTSVTGVSAALSRRRLDTQQRHRPQERRLRLRPVRLAQGHRPRRDQRRHRRRRHRRHRRPQRRQRGRRGNTALNLRRRDQPAAGRRTGRPGHHQRHRRHRAGHHRQSQHRLPGPQHRADRGRGHHRRLDQRLPDHRRRSEIQPRPGGQHLKPVVDRHRKRRRSEPGLSGHRLPRRPGFGKEGQRRRRRPRQRPGHRQPRDRKGLDTPRATGGVPEEHHQRHHPIPGHRPREHQRRRERHPRHRLRLRGRRAHTLADPRQRGDQRAGHRQPATPKRIVTARITASYHRSTRRKAGIRSLMRERRPTGRRSLF